MSTNYRVFKLESTGRCARYLRAYMSSECIQTRDGYHHSMARIEDEALVRQTSTYGRRYDVPASGIDHTTFWKDGRWPKHCACGYAFKEQDRQLFYETIYRRVDTGEEMVLRDAPIGACWDEVWTGPNSKGADGQSLCVRTPGGDWAIDSRASNCTMPGDSEHRCWVRHGTVEDGTLHVDKNGHTCAAGAGSIAFPTYHGFLHSGHLVQC